MSLRRLALGAFAPWIVAAGALAAPPVGRGFVDPAAFVDLAGGEEAVRVQVSVHKSMLQIMCAGLDKELGQVACGLDAISAVVVGAAGESAVRASKLMATTETRLKGDGWQRMALVKDEGSEVRVLVLDDGKAISGLVVMVLDHAEGELVFANLSGTIDLKRLERIGEELDLPGLNALEGIDK